MFSLKLPCDTDRSINCKTVSFNKKIVFFCGCTSNNPNKIYVYNVDEEKSILKETTIEKNLCGQNCQIIPKQ